MAALACGRLSEASHKTLSQCRQAMTICDPCVRLELKSVAHPLTRYLTGSFSVEGMAAAGMGVVWKRPHVSDAGEQAMLLPQAVEALAASCARGLQGLNTRIHCPQNSETVDLSEGASSVRMVRICAGKILCQIAGVHEGVCNLRSTLPDLTPHLHLLHRGVLGQLQEVKSSIYKEGCLGQ